MKKIMGTISLVLLLFIATAQVDTKFTTSNFPGKANEGNAAKSNISNGNSCFFAGDYANALKYYAQPQKLNPNIFYPWSNFTVRKICLFCSSPTKFTHSKKPHSYVSDHLFEL